MAIQPHRLDNGSDKLWGFFYPCGANSVSTLEQELKQTTLSVRQQHYIRGLMDQYYTRAITGAGTLTALIGSWICMQDSTSESQTAANAAVLAVNTSFLAYGIFLKYQNLQAQRQLKAQMAQRA